MTDRTSQELTYAGDARGYLATPEHGTGPAVLVLHAWWGLNDTIRTVCTRLADAGFVAFAPDLYHGKLATTIDDAQVLSKGLGANQDHVMVELAEATRFLSERAVQGDSNVAVVGFSLGAAYALDLAAADPDRIGAVVLFYGTGGGDWSASRASYLGHFAENDPYEPRAGVDEVAEELRNAGRAVTFYHYPDTGHWFFEPDHPDAYNEAAAQLAWERTLAFLRNTPTA